MEIPLPPVESFRSKICSLRKRCTTGDLKIEEPVLYTADKDEALKIIQERAAEMTLMKPYLSADESVEGDVAAKANERAAQKLADFLKQ